MPVTVSTRFSRARAGTDAFKRLLAERYCYCIQYMIVVASVQLYDFLTNACDRRRKAKAVAIEAMETKAIKRSNKRRRTREIAFETLTREFRLSSRMSAVRTLR